MVRSERLELSHLSAPEPKSGASTNSATTAANLYSHIEYWCFNKTLYKWWLLRDLNLRPHHYE